MIPPSLGVRTPPLYPPPGLQPPRGEGTTPLFPGVRTPPSMPCWSCEPPGGAKRTPLLPGLWTPPSISRRVCNPRKERERPPISEAADTPPSEPPHGKSGGCPMGKSLLSIFFVPPFLALPISKLRGVGGVGGVEMKI